MATASQVIAFCNRVLIEHLESEPMGAAADLAAPLTLIERTFDEQFDAILKAALSQHDWNCIRTRGEVAMTELDASSPYADEWTYSGTLPAKRLAVWGLRLGTEWGPWDQDDYLIEGGSIYTNCSSCMVVYSWYPRAADYGDGSAYNAAFNTAIGTYLDGLNPSLLYYLELEMAFRLCPLLSKSEAKREELQATIHGVGRVLGAKALAVMGNMREKPVGNAYGWEG